MMRSFVNYVQRPPPIPAMFIDGFLYAGIALFAFLGSQFGSDEAAKWLSPELLFWIRTVTGAIGAVFLSIKMFRSTAFSDHKEALAQAVAKEAKDEAKT